MSGRSLAALSAAFLALCAAVFVLSRRSAREESSPLAGWPAERVVRVELSRSGVRIVLEKKGGQWALAEPVPGLADQAAAKELVDALASMSLGGAVSTEPASAAAYGLDGLGAVRVSVFVEGRAAPVVDGSFGSPALGDAAVYFREERDSVVRLATGLPRGILERSPEDYRAKTRK